MDRVDEAQAVLGNPALSPALATGDREFLEDTLRRVRRTIETRGYAEQLLHGEPHPGNLLGTNRGPRFIDLETCCRGPIEFDVAHVTEAARRSYPHADEQLVGDCRRLVLAMVAAWRVEPNDQLPNGPRALQLLLDALRAGPPWPALDAVMR
jgi:Ser/Thr protein kinase RdoA (MazF antagonist)